MGAKGYPLDVVAKVKMDAKKSKPNQGKENGTTEEESNGDNLDMNQAKQRKTRKGENTYTPTEREYITIAILNKTRRNFNLPISTVKLRISYIRILEV